MRSKVRRKGADKAAVTPVVSLKAAAAQDKAESGEMLRRYGPLTCAEVCAIVESCHARNVLSLKFRGLELGFQPGPAPGVDIGLPGTSEGFPLSPSTAAGRAAEIEEMRGRLRELDGPARVGGVPADQVEATEDEIEMLKVTDPAAWEQMMNRSTEFDDVQPG